MADPSEQRFRHDYSARWSTLDVVLSSIAVASYVAKLMLSQLKLTANAATLALWVHLALSASVLITFHLLGRDRYAALVRGPLSICSRLLTAVGLGLNLRPQDCRLCPLFWSHRLLWSNIAVVVIKIPTTWYWAGGVVSVIAALVVDAADPGCTCRQSGQCLLQAAAAQLSARWQLGSVFAAATNAATHLAGVTLPGLLLVYLEQQARRLWLQQHPAVTGGANNSSTLQTAECNTGIKAGLQQNMQQNGPESDSSAGSSFIDFNSSQEASTPMQTTADRPSAESPTLDAMTGTAFKAPGAAKLLAAMASASNSLSRTRKPTDIPTHYCSPVVRSFTGVKLEQPADAGPVDLRAIRTIIGSSLQASWAAATPIGLDRRPSCPAAAVLEACAFPGCYQLVYEVISPASTSLVEESIRQSLPAGWGLIEVQHCEAGVAAQVTKQATSQSAQSLGAEGVVLDPLALAWPPISAEAPQNSDSTSRQGATGGTCAAVSAVLRVNSALVQQQVSKGYERVRVVITERPMGAVLFDSSWALAAHTALDDATLDLRFAANTDQNVKLEPGSKAEVQLLSVIVLAEAPGGYSDAELQAGRVSAATAATHTKAAIMAHLPLLLLPAAAHTELQQLAAAAAAETGLAAHEVLLPLLEDWAALQLLTSRLNDSNSTSEAHITARQTAEGLYELIAVFLTANGMDECHKLLPQSGSMLVLADSPAECTAVESGTALPNIKGHDVDGGDIDAAGSKALSHRLLTQCGAGGQNCSNAGMSSAGSAGGKRNPLGSEKAGSGSEATSNTSAALPAGVDACAVATDVGVTSLVRAVLFGYASGSIEHAYNHWKGLMLQRHDSVMALFYMLGMMLNVCRLLVLSNSAMCALVLVKLLSLSVHLLPHSALWVLSSRLQQPSAAGRWRGLIVNVFCLASLLLCVQLFLQSNTLLLRAAMIDVIDSANTWALLRWSLRHIAVPLTLRVGVFSMLLYLLLVNGPNNAVFGRPEVWFLGPVASMVAGAACSLLIAVILETRMRRAFARHV